MSDTSKIENELRAIRELLERIANSVAPRQVQHKSAYADTDFIGTE